MVNEIGNKVFLLTKGNDEPFKIEPFFKNEVYYSKWEDELYTTGEIERVNLISNGVIKNTKVLSNNTFGKTSYYKTGNWSKSETFLFPITLYSLKDVQKIINDKLVEIKKHIMSNEKIGIVYDFDINNLSDYKYPASDIENLFELYNVPNSVISFKYRYVYISDKVKITTTKSFIEVTFDFYSDDFNYRSGYLNEDDIVNEKDMILSRINNNFKLEFENQVTDGKSVVFASGGKIHNPILCIQLSNERVYDDIVLNIFPKYIKEGEITNGIMFTLNLRQYTSKHPIPNFDNYYFLCIDMVNGTISWAKMNGNNIFDKLNCKSYIDYSFSYDSDSQIDFLDKKNIELFDGYYINFLSIKNDIQSSISFRVLEG